MSLEKMEKDSELTEYMSDSDILSVIMNVESNSVPQTDIPRAEFSSEGASSAGALNAVHGFGRDYFDAFSLRQPLDVMAEIIESRMLGYRSSLASLLWTREWTPELEDDIILHLEVEMGKTFTAGKKAGPEKHCDKKAFREAIQAALLNVHHSQKLRKAGVDSEREAAAVEVASKFCKLAGWVSLPSTNLLIEDFATKSLGGGLDRSPHGEDLIDPITPFMNRSRDADIQDYHAADDLADVTFRTQRQVISSSTFLEPRTPAATDRTATPFECASPPHLPPEPLASQAGPSVLLEFSPPKTRARRGSADLRTPINLRTAPLGGTEANPLRTFTQGLHRLPGDSDLSPRGDSLTLSSTVMTSAQAPSSSPSRHRSTVDPLPPHQHHQRSEETPALVSLSAVRAKSVEEAPPQSPPRRLMPTPPRARSPGGSPAPLTNILSNSPAAGGGQTKRDPSPLTKPSPRATLPKLRPSSVGGSNSELSTPTRTGTLPFPASSGLELPSAAIGSPQRTILRREASSHMSTEDRGGESGEEFVAAVSAKGGVALSFEMAGPKSAAPPRRRRASVTKDEDAEESNEEEDDADFAGTEESLLANKMATSLVSKLTSVLTERRGVERLRHPERPFTTDVGNWGIKAAVEKLGTDCQCEAFMGKKVAGQGAKKVTLTFSVAQKDDEETKEAQWAAIKSASTKPKSCLLFHLTNHYALIFAWREWSVNGVVKKQVLTARRGQRPSSWIDFEEVRNVLIGWSGYRLMRVSKSA